MQLLEYILWTLTNVYQTPQRHDASSAPRRERQIPHLILRSLIFSDINFSFCLFFFLSFGVTAPPWGRASSLTRFLDHTQRRTTVGKTSLDEWSARRRDLYLTTHSTHNRQTSMTPVVFEPTISARERPQTHALDRAATGTGGYEPHTIYVLWLARFEKRLRAHYIRTSHKSLDHCLPF